MRRCGVTASWYHQALGFTPWGGHRVPCCVRLLVCGDRLVVDGAVVVEGGVVPAVMLLIEQNDEWLVGRRYPSVHRSLTAVPATIRSYTTNCDLTAGSFALASARSHRWFERIATRRFPGYTITFAVDSANDPMFPDARRGCGHGRCGCRDGGDHRQ
jgi:hypothetical protein